MATLKTKEEFESAPDGCSYYSASTVIPSKGLEKFYVVDIPDSVNIPASLMPLLTHNSGTERNLISGYVDDATGKIKRIGLPMYDVPEKVIPCFNYWIGIDTGTVYINNAENVLGIGFNDITEHFANYIGYFTENQTLGIMENYVPSTRAITDIVCMMLYTSDIRYAESLLLTADVSKLTPVIDRTGGRSNWDITYTDTPEYTTPPTELGKVVEESNAVVYNDMLSALLDIMDNEDEEDAFDTVSSVDITTTKLATPPSKDVWLNSDAFHEGLADFGSQGPNKVIDIFVSLARQIKELVSFLERVSPDMFTGSFNQNPVPTNEELADEYVAANLRDVKMGTSVEDVVEYNAKYRTPKGLPPLKTIPYTTVPNMIFHRTTFGATRTESTRNKATVYNEGVAAAIRYESQVRPDLSKENEFSDGISTFMDYSKDGSLGLAIKDKYNVPKNTIFEVFSHAVGLGHSKDNIMRSVRSNISNNHRGTNSGLTSFDDLYAWTSNIPAKRITQDGKKANIVGTLHAQYIPAFEFASRYIKKVAQALATSTI